MVCNTDFGNLAKLLGFREEDKFLQSIQNSLSYHTSFSPPDLLLFY